MTLMFKLCKIEMALNKEPGSQDEIAPSYNEHLLKDLRHVATRILRSTFHFKGLLLKVETAPGSVRRSSTSTDGIN